MKQKSGKKKQNKSKLSVVITAHNSEKILLACLESVKFADEVIVVNNESSDDTVKIAKKVGAVVYDHKNNPKKLNQSKNFGFKKAKNSWILSLDTDERVESDLKKEIIHLIEEDSDKDTNGYLIPRHNVIFGKVIEHGLWYPDYQLRLFRKEKGSFADKHNHERLEIEGEPGTLTGHIKHLNYQTISQYIQKIDRQYSENEADNYLAEGKKVEWYDAIRFPMQDFLSNYFMRKGYKDGLHGLVLSILQAIYMFVVWAKMWEKQGFRQQEISLKDSQSEFSRIWKQFLHWYSKETGDFVTKVKKFIS